MTCIQIGGGVHVCRASDNYLRRRIIRWPVCERMREMVVRYEGWHGPTVMCTGCGDSWQDGELSYRPFERGWRKRSVEYYRRLWDVATYGPAPTYAELFGEPELTPDAPMRQPEVVTVHLPPSSVDEGNPDHG